MSLIELFILAVGLSMDAFAVSVCKGLSLGKIKAKHMCIAGAWFGGFQALMPLIGYFLGGFFAGMIEQYDHWVAFALLALISGNMIKESFSKESESINDDINFKAMIVLAIATSIDALAVGITFAFFKVNIIFAITLIGIITFILSVIGTKVGNKFGDKYENNAEFLGGVILILLGLKILLEHLGILNF